MMEDLFTITVMLWVGYAASTIITLYTKEKRKDKNETRVLFFPDSKIACKKFVDGEVCDNRQCGYAHEETSLSILMNQLYEAKKSLEVAVFIITNQDLADVLISLHRSGIIVRIITDCENMDLNCSQIEQFRENGIQVRHDKTSNLMHHKFAIIDKKIIVNGSFNWTKQAVTGNQENIIISKSKNIVKPYQKEFERLWKIYNPIG